MRSEHPRGAVQHVGAQLRYLLVSDHGVLGALGFAAAALTLAARDTFIGWDADQRSRQLHRVIGLSRFLIRSSVHCRNLASKALGLALRRLPDDFQHRYGYRPLLVETFVEKGRYQGTSLAAANWLRVGETAGRGRFAAPGWAMYAWGSGWCKLCEARGSAHEIVPGSGAERPVGGAGPGCSPASSPSPPSGFKIFSTSFSRSGYSIGPCPTPECAPASWKKNGDRANRWTTTCRTPFWRQRRPVAGLLSSHGTPASFKTPASKSSIHGPPRTDKETGDQWGKRLKDFKRLLGCWPRRGKAK